MLPLTFQCDHQVLVNNVADYKGILALRDKCPKTMQKCEGSCGMVQYKSNTNLIRPVLRQQLYIIITKSSMLYLRRMHI